jgi:LEA14-like dessication related protein
MKPFQLPIQLPIPLIPLLLLVSICSACGPHQVKGKAPLVSISSLTVTEQRMDAAFNIRNINDVAMDIEQIEATIRIQEVELTRHVSTVALSIDPNTTEEIAVQKLPEEFSRELLETLERGDVGNLPFMLEGRMRTTQDGNVPFRYEGFLYPVPGRPGHYRSASSRTREQD